MQSTKNACMYYPKHQGLIAAIAGAGGNLGAAGFNYLAEFLINPNKLEADEGKYYSEKISSKYTIQRSKGLGENDPDMMWETTMNPETRRLIQVVPENIEEAEEMFDRLLGDDLPGRKEMIANEGYRYLDLADMS